MYKLRARERQTRSRMNEPLVAEHLEWMKQNMNKLTQKDSWDVPLPESIVKEWNEIINQLPLLRDLKIPRYLHFTESAEADIILFTDASLIGMGACCYLRVVTDNEIYVNLLASASKVKPLNASFEHETSEHLIIARLELLSCEIGAKLAMKMKNELHLENARIIAFTDSIVSIYWLTSEEDHSSVFVRTRVRSTREHVESDNWHHVAGIENPSDYASRSLLPSQLIESKALVAWPRLFKREKFTIRVQASTFKEK
ncbi:hypothetical protein PVAND_014995 [Polypedilum vanderplanki]|uniref:Uncharacterized protein n=1 Tax=Polypedilum vanderplanki TaxID=319348 RepID=A0A9J6BBP9_POLVA|nr:hypothetical protein PVAND_014995 [Polypedilum vanderplanki]